MSMRAYAVTVAVYLIGSVFTVEAAQIRVACDNAELVRGQSLLVVQYTQKQFPGIANDVLLKDRPVFDERGRCVVQLAAGEYLLQTQSKQKDGTLVALTSGKVTVADADQSLTLVAGDKQAVSLRHNGKELGIASLDIRMAGTMERVEWARTQGGTPWVILSPNQQYRMRVLADDAAGNIHAALWLNVPASRLALNTELPWVSECSFAWDAEEHSRFAGGAFTLWLPEADTLEFPLRAETTLVTNRRLLDTSYGYETRAGEHLEIRRQLQEIASPKFTFRCGGPYKAVAYIEQLQSWKCGATLVWGADLVNGAEQNVFIPNHPAARTDGKGYSGFYPEPRQKMSSVRFKQTLRRSDGQPVPHDTDLPTKEEQASFVGADLAKVFVVDISYVLDDKTVSETLTPGPFVTYRSDRWSMPGPAAWFGRIQRYHDTLNRMYDACIPVSKRQPAFMTLGWFNHNKGCYTAYTDPIAMTLEFHICRDRMDPFRDPDLSGHEMLHALGYKHGPEHDKAISDSYLVFNRGRIQVADQPDYLPMSLRRVEVRGEK